LRAAGFTTRDRFAFVIGVSRALTSSNDHDVTGVGRADAFAPTFAVVVRGDPAQELHTDTVCYRIELIADMTRSYVLVVTKTEREQRLQSDDKRLDASPVRTVE
jgi:hypothetical protein